jgi:hypothetical protein
VVFQPSNQTSTASRQASFLLGLIASLFLWNLKPFLHNPEIFCQRNLRNRKPLAMIRSLLAGRQRLSPALTQSRASIFRPAVSSRFFSTSSDDDDDSGGGNSSTVSSAVVPSSKLKYGDEAPVRFLRKKAPSP